MILGAVVSASPQGGTVKLCLSLKGFSMLSSGQDRNLRRLHAILGSDFFFLVVCLECRFRYARVGQQVLFCVYPDWLAVSVEEASRSQIWAWRFGVLLYLFCVLALCSPWEIEAPMAGVAVCS